MKPNQIKIGIFQQDESKIERLYANEEKHCYTIRKDYVNNIFPDCLTLENYDNGSWIK